MLSTKEVADILGTTVRTIQRAALAIEETTYIQFGVPGRGTTYYRSHEIDQLKAKVAEPVFARVYGPTTA